MIDRLLITATHCDSITTARKKHDDVESQLTTVFADIASELRNIKLDCWWLIKPGYFRGHGCRKYYGRSRSRTVMDPSSKDTKGFRGGKVSPT